MPIYKGIKMEYYDAENEIDNIKYWKEIEKRNSIGR